MSICTESSTAAQERRLRLKEQSQRLHQQLVAGTNLSSWEGDILLKTIEEVYFREAENRPLREGEMRFTCVSASAPAGRSLDECAMVTVVLTMFAAEDDSVVLSDNNLTAQRRERILRYTDEAREQGGFLTQEDLSQLLHCNVRTIRNDIQYLRKKHGIITPTRGQQKDIGPGVTHKALALRWWLEGKDATEVATHIKHSLTAVERYIQTFARCVYCARKDFSVIEIALTVGISCGSASSYLEIYEEFRSKPDAQHRWEELDIIGEQHYTAFDVKKGIPPSPTSLKNPRRTP